MRDDILKALENKNFTERILNFVNEDQVKQAFNEIGIEISDEEIMELAKYLGRIYDDLRNMPLEELEKITAGSAWKDYKKYMINNVATPINNCVFHDKDVIRFQPKSKERKYAKKAVETASWVVPIVVAVPVAYYAIEHVADKTANWIIKIKTAGSQEN